MHIFGETGIVLPITGVLAWGIGGQGTGRGVVWASIWEVRTAVNYLTQYNGWIRRFILRSRRTSNDRGAFPRPIYKTSTPCFPGTQLLIVPKAGRADSCLPLLPLLASLRPDSVRLSSPQGTKPMQCKKCWLVLLIKTQIHTDLCYCVIIQPYSLPPPPLSYCGKSGCSDVRLAHMTCFDQHSISGRDMREVSRAPARVGLALMHPSGKEHTWSSCCPFSLGSAIHTHEADLSTAQEPSLVEPSLDQTGRCLSSWINACCKPAGLGVICDTVILH